jgi:hypothetical protein
VVCGNSRLLCDPGHGWAAEDLINAALRKDKAAVTALLAKGADVNGKENDGMTVR